MQLKFLNLLFQGKLLFVNLFLLYWCFACIYVGVRVLDPGVRVVNFHVGTGTWTRDPWKSSQRS